MTPTKSQIIERWAERIAAYVNTATGYGDLGVDDNDRGVAQAIYADIEEAGMVVVELAQLEEMLDRLRFPAQAGQARECRRIIRSWLAAHEKEQEDEG